MSDRRTFLLAPLAFCGLPGPIARAAGKVKRVGVIAWFPPSARGMEAWAAFDGELRARDWVEARNIVFERRYFRGDPARLQAMLAELVALDVDLILAQGAPAALAAKNATDRIPILFDVGDARGRGIVTNVARPEANATGVSGRGKSIIVKQIEVLKRLAPSISRVAALMNTDLGYPSRLFEDPKPRGVEVFIVDLRGPQDLATAMHAVSQRRADAVLVAQAWDVGENDLPAFRADIVQAIADRRLPGHFASREFVERGGLVAYAGSPVAESRQLAIYADKLLRGVRPRDLPVVSLSVFNLFINARTARNLGIVVPREMLVRADWIVE